MRSLIVMRLRFAAAIFAVLLPLAPVARAQEAPPPARVGQIAEIAGPVSFDSGGGGGWTTAVPNYPMIAGDSLYTQPGAEAGITIDWSRIQLAGATELQLSRLDPDTADLVLPQGEAYLHLRYLAPGGTYSVTTPRGTVTFQQDGRYAVRAGDADNPTMISVIDGSAALQGQGVLMRIGAGETATLSGDRPVIASLGPLVTDPFIDRMLAREVPPPPPVAPAIITGMTGGAVLSAYGSWSEVPEYGAIWYPRVATGWAPYRHGHWAFVPPWGWTWIDDYPWGFAPFHYGRWIDHDGRWGWLPAPVGFNAPPDFRPVYAPALVSFFDVGSGVAVSIGLSGPVGGAIGWVPLAPDEPYLPWYRSSPRYIERLNLYDVRDARRFRDFDERRFVEEHHPARLANRAAATVITAEAMRRGDPVGRFGRPAPRVALDAARPVAPEHAGVPAGDRFGRLPGAPGPAFHRPAAPKPRPAPFAQRRGLPIDRARPVPGQVKRPEMRIEPRKGPPAGTTRQPAMPRVIEPRLQPGAQPPQFQRHEQPRPQPQFQQREQPRPQPQFQQREQPRPQPQVQRHEQPRPQPQFQQREQPRPQPQFQQREQPRPQPQFQHREQPRPQPQFQQREQPRPQPQFQHREQPRPQPQFQQREQPRPEPQVQHREQPRPQPRPVPQQPERDRVAPGQNGA